MHAVRLRWFLEEYEREALSKIKEARQRHYCALISAGRVDSQGWVSSQQVAIELLQSLSHHYAPWDYRAELSAHRSQQALIARYHDMYGAPGTPSHDALVAQFEAELNLPREQRMVRKLRDRENRRRGKRHGT